MNNALETAAIVYKNDATRRFFEIFGVSIAATEFGYIFAKGNVSTLPIKKCFKSLENALEPLTTQDSCYDDFLIEYDLEDNAGSLEVYKSETFVRGEMKKILDTELYEGLIKILNIVL